MCIDDPSVLSPQNSPVKLSQSPGLDISDSALEIDTGETGNETENLSVITEETDSDLVDQLDTVLDEILKARSAPAFLQQKEESVLLDNYQKMDELLSILNDGALRFLLQVVESDSTEKIFRELLATIRQEMRSFRKTRQELKFFVKVETLLILTFALLRSEVNRHAGESGKILEIMEFVAVNVNTRINESIVFCKYLIQFL